MSTTSNFIQSLFARCYLYSSVFRIHGLAMFLNPRLKDRISSNKVNFRTKVISWIKEECGQELELLSTEVVGKQFLICSTLRSLYHILFQRYTRLYQSVINLFLIGTASYLKTKQAMSLNLWIML